MGMGEEQGRRKVTIEIEDEEEDPRDAQAPASEDAEEDEASDEILDLDEGEEDLQQVMRDAEAAVEDVESQRKVDIDRLEQELADLRDRSMRTLADFDNFRKRAERERREVRRYALLEPMRDLLEVVDNLERALEAGGSAEDLKQGVEMILRQLDDLMRRHGVKAVEAEGRPFDPTVHEAVSRVDSDEVDEPIVEQEMQRGYLLHDRLLRPSRVVVAVPSEESSEDGSEEEPVH